MDTRETAMYRRRHCREGLFCAVRPAPLNRRAGATMPAGLEAFQRFFQGAVHQVRVDFRGGDVAVPEGALDDQQVTGAAVKPGGESVAQAVRRDGFLDAGFLEPVGKAVAHLSR